MKQAIIEELRKDGTTIADAEKMLDAVTGAIFAVAKSHGKANVPGFGTFSIKHQSERQMRNIQTGEMMTVAASNKLAFKQAKGLNV